MNLLTGEETWDECWAKLKEANYTPSRHDNTNVVVNTDGSGYIEVYCKIGAAKYVPYRSNFEEVSPNVPDHLAAVGKHYYMSGLLAVAGTRETGRSLILLDVR